MFEREKNDAIVKALRKALVECLIEENQILMD